MISFMTFAVSDSMKVNQNIKDAIFHFCNKHILSILHHLHLHASVDIDVEDTVYIPNEVNNSLISLIFLGDIDVATTIPRKVQDVLKKTNISGVRDILNNSRRIVVGTEALNNRPYMVSNRSQFNYPASARRHSVNPIT